MNNKVRVTIISLLISIPLLFYFFGLTGLLKYQLLGLLFINSTSFLIRLFTKKKWTYFIPIIGATVLSIIGIVFVYFSQDQTGNWGLALFLILCIQIIALAILSIPVYYIIDYYYFEHHKIVLPIIFVKNKNIILLPILVIFTVISYLRWTYSLGNSSIFTSLSFIVVLSFFIIILIRSLRHFDKTNYHLFYPVLIFLIIFGINNWYLLPIGVGSNIEFITDIVHFSLLLFYIYCLSYRIYRSLRGYNY